MTREELKAMGLSDEQVDSVMAAHGKSTNALKEKADSVEGLESQITDYKSQIAERDTQLDELKKVDADGLKAKIDELKTANETAATEYQEQLDKQAKDFALDKALTGAKSKNNKAVIANLDLDTIKFKDGEITGLKEQLETLQESDAYLFEQEQTNDTKPNFTTGNHTKGSGKLTQDDFNKLGYKERLKLKQDSPEEYNSLTGQ